MIVIRKEQYDAMRESMQAELDAEMVAHLRRHFPGETIALDDAQLLAFAQEGRRHAWRHGAEDPAAVCRFIDVRTALGAEFDVDPELAWVAEPLRDLSIDQADARIEEMSERAVEWLRRGKPERGPA